MFRYFVNTYKFHWNPILVFHITPQYFHCIVACLIQWGTSTENSMVVPSIVFLKSDSAHGIHAENTKLRKTHKTKTCNLKFICQHSTHKWPPQTHIIAYIAIVATTGDNLMHLYQRPSKIRRITTPESVSRDRRATYVLPCTALLTLRAAHAKYGETRSLSSCLALGPIYRRIYVQFCNSL